MSSLREQSFAERVEVQSSLSGETHAYPRPDLHALHQYLKTPSAAVLQPEDTSDAKLDTSDFIVIHNLTSGIQTSFGSLSSDITCFSRHEIGLGPVLVFLRGHASPEWLEAVAAKFGVSAELYQRHLHWRAFSSGDRDLHSLPPLPSWNTRTFQLTIPTICQRSDVGFSVEPEDLQDDRRQGKEHMKQYFKNMRTRAHVGDSVVRKCLLFSKRDFVIEQNITIEVLPTVGDSWQAVVWLDSGRDLSQSVEGPWMPHEGTPSWQTYFFPVIVRRTGGNLPTGTSTSGHNAYLTAAAAAAATTQSRSPTPSLRGVGHKPLTEWKAAQNICALPLHYGSQMDREMVRDDVLYALSDVLQFVASSELQFFNFLRRRVEHELSYAGQDEVGRRNAIALMNLEYVMTQVNYHVRRLAEVVRVLEHRGWSAWPIAAESSEAGKVAHQLMVDFKYLLEHAQNLIRACESGMNTLANSSVLEETRRSTDNAMRLQRLTVIATVFIPLSFVCSVWGMNFRELGSGSQPLWMYAATAVPVILLSFLIYHSDRIVWRGRKVFELLRKLT